MSLRRFFAVSTAALTLGATSAAIAQTAAPAAAPAPMTSARQVGNATVTSILDGRGQFPVTIFRNIDAAAAVSLLQAGGEFIESANGPAWHATVSAFVVDTGGRRVLIDTGVGSGMGGIGGRLPAGLAAAGVTPESIQLIVISHFHGDHIGGLLDEAGAARFPQATLSMHHDELAYWTDPARGDSGAQARGIVAAYGDRVRAFTSGELAPGLTAEPAIGHTPGHTVYRLTSGTEQMVFIGDMIHAVSLQAPRPDVSLAFDNDAAAARRVRDAFTARAAEQRTLIAAPHFPFPGIGRLERDGQAYRYVPVPPPAR